MDAYDAVIFARTDKGARIGTAEDMLGAVRTKQTTLAGWFEGEARKRFFDFQGTPAGTASAEIVHGRWLVKCDVCGGAEETSWREPVFYCLSCGNALHDGKVMAVNFPAEREAIETALLKRDVANRNWKPGETLETLQEENEQWLG